jgi:hypothetical protein
MYISIHIVVIYVAQYQTLTCIHIALHYIEGCVWGHDRPDTSLSIAKLSKRMRPVTPRKTEQ